MLHLLLSTESSLCCIYMYSSCWHGGTINECTGVVTAWFTTDGKIIVMKSVFAWDIETEQCSVYLSISKCTNLHS